MNEMVGSTTQGSGSVKFCLVLSYFLKLHQRQFKMQALQDELKCLKEYEDVLPTKTGGAFDSRLEEEQPNCIPGCTIASADVPVLPCGLCDCLFHFQCVGLPAGSSIRGLYFCAECTDMLRDIPLLEQRRVKRDERLLALESVVSDCMTIRKNLRQISASGSERDSSHRRDGGQAPPRADEMSCAMLVMENAALRRKLSDIADGRRCTLPDDIQSRQRFEAIAKIQRDVHARSYEEELMGSSSVVTNTDMVFQNKICDNGSGNEENECKASVPSVPNHVSSKDDRHSDQFAKDHAHNCRI